MGYSYIFRIALNSYPETWKDLSDDAKFDKLQNFIPQFQEVHEELRKRDWFPAFGKQEYSGARGYGTGPGDHFTEEIGLFTTRFPEFVFLIYAFHWDFTNLTIVRVQGPEVKMLKELSYEEVKVEGLHSFSISMSPENVDITNEITGIFTGKDKTIDLDI